MAQGWHTQLQKITTNNMTRLNTLSTKSLELIQRKVQIKRFMTPLAVRDLFFLRRMMKLAQIQA